MTATRKEFLYGDLTYELNSLLFSVHNELGRFAREKQYGDLLEEKMKVAGIRYQREVRVGDSGNVLDFLVEDSIVLELKTKPFLLREDYAQVQRYLHVVHLRLGILVNFRPKYLQPKRILHVDAHL